MEKNDMDEKMHKNRYEKYYEEYYSDVVDYSIEVYKKFALHNTMIFLLYGLGLSVIEIEMQRLVCGLCFGMAGISFATFFFMRYYFLKNKKHVMVYSNVYLTVLLIMLILMYFYHASNVSYTILICTVITTAMTCMLPLHYIITICGVFAVELALFFAQNTGKNIVDIIGYILNDILVIVFATGINFLYVDMKFREFKKSHFLRNESYRDPLTKLYNRRYVEDYVEMNLDAGERCAVILIDLDNFKNVNDKLGHEKGDELLCKVSNILKANFRKTDCVARIGGDEFLVIMSQVINKENVVEKMKKILKEFPIVVQGEQQENAVEVSLSVGITFTKSEEDNCYEELYRRADRYMYKAKNRGKGCAVMEGKGGKEHVISMKKGV